MLRRRRGCTRAGKTRWAGRTRKPVHLMLDGTNRQSVHFLNVLSLHTMTMARSADCAPEVLRLPVNGVRMEIECSQDVMSQRQPGNA